MNRDATSLRIERVDATNVRIGGAVDFSDANDAVARTDEIIGASKDVTVDLRGLARADSATLGIVLLWAARAATRGVRLRFARVPDGLRALARLCDAESFLGLT